MYLTSIERESLLNIARSAIEHAVRGEKVPQADASTHALKQDSGAFVSIHRGGKLRGCIGTFASPNPLFQTVNDMAIAAALQDPRFPAVAPEELKSLKIEISILSPLTEIKDPKEIEIGKHGLYIAKGKRRGVLLPQVATEYNFDRETFLDQTCIKAGLEPGEWREGATIFIFEAEIVKEE